MGTNVCGLKYDPEEDEETDDENKYQYTYSLMKEFIDDQEENKPIKNQKSLC